MWSTFAKVGLQKCPFERFLLATVLVVAEVPAVAGVAKVDLSTPPCLSEPGVSKAPLPCARGDTTGGRIGLTLFTQILKGCGRTC